MLDAVISDCDGVIADSEPIHFACFRDVLARRDVVLTERDYYDVYLGYDDHDVFMIVGRDTGRDFSEDDIAEMTAEKTVLVQQTMHESLQPMPGVGALFAALAEAGVPMAVCSGALREEVELATINAGIRDGLSVLVCAEDASKGKPDPEGYRLALAGLVETVGRPLEATRTVVLEDSPAGIESAKALGMKVLAVTTSYPAEALTTADRIVASLADVTVDDLAALV